MLNGHKIVSALDLGTTTTNAVIMEAEPGGTFSILGRGQYPTEGFINGEVSDPVALGKVIADCLSQAEEMAGMSATGLVVSIGGEAVRIVDNEGGIPLLVRSARRRGHRIGRQDVKKAVDNAGAVALPVDLQLLHVLPLSFRIDNQRVVDPVGLAGTRLDVRVRVVAAHQRVLNAVRQAAAQADVRVVKFCYRPLATSRSVLTEEERRAGSCLVDIGGDHTDVAVFKDGLMTAAATLMIGANSITSDTGALLGISVEEAEKIKIEYGHCCAGLTEDQSFAVSGHGEDGALWRTWQKADLVDTVIQPRAEEILEEAFGVIRGEVGEDEMPSKAVLTGGGVQLGGFQRLASAIFPFRVSLISAEQLSVNGVRSEGGGFFPQYATAVGLVMYDSEQKRQRLARITDNPVGRFFSGILKRINTIT